MTVLDVFLHATANGTANNSYIFQPGDMIYSVGDPAMPIYNQPYHQAVQSIQNQGSNLIMTVQRGGDHIIENTGFQKQPAQPGQNQNNAQPSVIKRTVRMERPNQNTSWGFQIYGGRDFGQPLLISKITPGSMAQQVSIYGNNGKLFGTKNRRDATAYKCMICTNELIEGASVIVDTLCATSLRNRHYNERLLPFKCHL